MENSSVKKVKFFTKLNNDISAIGKNVNYSILFTFSKSTFCKTVSFIFCLTSNEAIINRLKLFVYQLTLIENIKQVGKEDIVKSQVKSFEDRLAAESYILKVMAIFSPEQFNTSFGKVSISN